MVAGLHIDLPGIQTEIFSDGITILFGPSASGKTTLLRTLAGLLRPPKGVIKYDGLTWLDADAGIFTEPQKRNIGFVFQDTALFPHLSVESNITYGLFRKNKQERKALAGRLLSRFGIEHLRDKKATKISGGEMQKVAFARALAPSPAVMLLDEPFSSLDILVRKKMRKELRNQFAGLNIPVIFVTHDREEAKFLGKYIIVLHERKLVQQGLIDDVLANPSIPELSEKICTCEQ